MNPPGLHQYGSHFPLRGWSGGLVNVLRGKKRCDRAGGRTEISTTEIAALGGLK